MKDGELGILATHLGHDVKTHKEYYRLSSATVEITTVCIKSIAYLTNIFTLHSNQIIDLVYLTIM